MTNPICPVRLDDAITVVADMSWFPVLSLMRG